MGYLNQDHLLAGDFDLAPQKAFEALGRVAETLGLDPMKTAHGAYRIANSNMSRAINAVSSERGRDPRKFVLLVFGGAGALHGAEVARDLGIKQAIIAPYAGVFSAFGFTCADIERYWIRGFNRPWAPELLSDLTEIFDRLSQKALASLEKWVLGTDDVRIERQVDLRYYRQASELTINVPDGPLSQDVLDHLRAEFDREHDKTFGHAFDHAPVEVASVRVISKIPMQQPPLTRMAVRNKLVGERKTRKAYFGSETGMVDTSVLTDADLGETPVAGPVLIDRYDTTIVVPPGCDVHTAGACLVINT